MLGMLKKQRTKNVQIIQACCFCSGACFRLVQIVLEVELPYSEESF